MLSATSLARIGKIAVQSAARKNVAYASTRFALSTMASNAGGQQDLVRNVNCNSILQLHLY